MAIRHDGPEGPTARVFAVLEAVAERKRPVATAEIAEMVGLALATTHRIVANLEEQGLLQRGIDPKRWVVAPRLVGFGFKVVAATFHDAARHAVLQELAETLGEQVELGVVRNNNVVYLDSVRTARPVGLQIEPGRRAPLHCTSTGKLHLGHLPPTPQERLIHSLPLSRQTARTITEPLALISEVRKAKATGYASSNEELVVGVVGCALPILDQKGNMVAGLGVTVPLARLQGDSILKLLPSLRRAAERLRATFAAGEQAEPADAAEAAMAGSPGRIA